MKNSEINGDILQWNLINAFSMWREMFTGLSLGSGNMQDFSQMFVSFP